MYPLRPSQLLRGRDQIPQLEQRQKLIAYNVLNTTIQNYQENNFVAYVSRDNLIEVAFEMVKFLNDGQAFMEYQKPQSHIDN
mmetsp:Transcript_5460/g.9241  ORF Transcript_5460/g.9241 Transcript_5460/m.9241 type:complete len:82 (-) Transcript_5460:451-696(-)